MVEDPVIKTFGDQIRHADLAFKDASLEKQFLKDFAFSSLTNIKLAVGFSVLVYALFSILDYIIAPALFSFFFQIRFFYVIPFAIVVMIAFQFRLWIYYAQWLLSLLMISAGLGIVLMIAAGGETLLAYYYVGLILVLIFNYDFIKLRFVFATVSGWIVVLAYEVVCYSLEVSPEVWIMSSFFLVSANLFGMLSSYYFEFIIRRGFYVNKLLLDEKERTAQANQGLETKVAERSAELSEMNINLKEAEAKYRLILEYSSDMIWTTDQFGRMTFCNQQFLQVLGYESRPPDSLSVFRFLPERFHKKMHEKLKLAVKDTSLTFRIVFLTQSGKELLIDIQVSSMVSEKGMIEMLYFGKNINEVWRNEITRKIIHRIADKISSPVRIPFISEYIHMQLVEARVATHCYVAMISEKAADPSFVYPDENSLTQLQAESGLDFLRYVTHSAKPVIANREDMIILQSEGKIKAIDVLCKSWLGVPIKHKNQAVGAVVLLNYDEEKAFDEQDLEMMEVIAYYLSQLHSRYDSDRQVQEALAKAKESDHLKSTFLATMSHELRTPLNAIIGFSSLLDDNMSKEDVLDYAQTIHESGEHLLKIVQDILNITLLEDGSVLPSPENIMLSDITSELKPMVTAEQFEMRKGHLVVNWNQIDRLGHVVLETDRQMLKQVLLNLIKNSLKFTEQGHVAVGCDMIEEGGQHFLRFFVKDTGIGINPEQQTYIFDVFRQVDDTYTRRFGGIGVGLTIAARLVKMMGGRIWLESNSGQGTQFYFIIPDKLRIVATSRQEKEQDDETNVGIDNDGKRIALIVDDVENSFQLLSIMLSEIGFKSVWGKSGHEAVQICKSNPNISVVMMDLKMPGMDGYEATRLIKRLFPELPVVAQTAYAIMGDREKALDAGCDEYLSKPIMKERLHETVKMLVKVD